MNIASQSHKLYGDIAPNAFPVYDMTIDPRLNQLLVDVANVDVAPTSAATWELGSTAGLNNDATAQLFPPDLARNHAEPVTLATPVLDPSLPYKAVGILPKTSPTGRDSSLVVRRPKCPAPDFERFKPHIHQLYIVKNLALPDVMELMASRHNFKPSVKMYKDRFRRWKWFKYSTKTQQSEHPIPREELLGKGRTINLSRNGGVRRAEANRQPANSTPKNRTLRQAPAMAKGLAHFNIDMKGIDVYLRLTTEAVEAAFRRDLNWKTASLNSFVDTGPCLKISATFRHATRQLKYGDNLLGSRLLRQGFAVLSDDFHVLDPHCLQSMCLELILTLFRYGQGQIVPLLINFVYNRAMLQLDRFYRVVIALAAVRPLIDSPALPGFLASVASANAAARRTARGCVDKDQLQLFSYSPLPLPTSTLARIGHDLDRMRLGFAADIEGTRWREVHDIEFLFLNIQSLSGRFVNDFLARALRVQGHMLIDVCDSTHAGGEVFGSALRVHQIIRSFHRARGTQPPASFRDDLDTVVDKLAMLDVGDFRSGMNLADRLEHLGRSTDAVEYRRRLLDSEGYRAFVLECEVEEKGLLAEMKASV